MGNKRNRYARAIKDAESFNDFLDNSKLGQKLGLYKFLTTKLEQPIDLDNIGHLDEWDIRERLGSEILGEMISRHKRVDHREHWAMIEYLSDLGFEIVQLETGSGDVSTTKVSIERKEDDLLPSLFDDRRLRQLAAMRENADHSFLVVTKSYEQIRKGARERNVSDSVLIGFIASLCAIGYPPVFIGDRFDASKLMNKITDKIEDDKSRVYVPRPKAPDPGEYRNALIEALPGIGIKSRRKIVEAFPSMSRLCSASIQELEEIEGIGKKTAHRIHEILNAED